MSESEFAVVRSIGFLAAAVLAVSLQRFTPHARLRGSWRTNLGLWAVDGLLVGVVCGGCAYSVARWATTAGIGVLAWAPAPPALAIAASIVVLDLVSYGWHRANHQCRWLWQFHQVHHSDRAFTVSTGVRFHPGEILLSLPVRLSAVVVLGAPPLGGELFEVIFAVANLVGHGDIDLPARAERRLARLLITPALHRRHHSTEVSELNRNFGTIFSIWDRWLGTLLWSDSAARLQTGLPGESGTVSFAQALALPHQHRPERRP